MNETIGYHCRELEIARDPGDARHIMPTFSNGERAVLDIGCGIGQTFVAAGVGSGRLAVGVDIDFASLSYGRTHFGHIAFVNAQAEFLPFRARSFDLVVSRVSLPYTHIPLSVAGIGRVLTEGGRTWLVLHPLSMTLRHLGKALVARKMRDFVYGVYILANGIVFHMFGRLMRFPTKKTYESFQTVPRMRKLLASRGFVDVRIEDRRRFVLTAKKRAAGGTG